MRRHHLSLMSSLRLAELQVSDRAAFERLRAQLKAAGFKRLGALDEELAKINGLGTGEIDKSQTDVLLELATEARLFHSPDGTAYADVWVDGHRETHGIYTRAFKRWLRRLFFEETNGAPSSEAMNGALGVLEAKAYYEGPERDIYVRVAGLARPDLHRHGRP